MRIILLTTKFNHFDGSPWLVSELVEELLHRGNEVTVINIDWSGNSTSAVESIGRAGFTYKYLLPYDSSIPRLGMPLKWLFSSLKALPFLFGLLFRGQKFDMSISFSPCMATYAIHPLLKFLSVKSLLIYWDYFPVHNEQILAKIPKILMPMLKYAENKSIRLYDFLGLMSPRSVDFANSYFSLKKSQSAFVLPVWTSLLNKPPESRFAIRCELGLSADRVIVVFGGQLIPGRGVTELCRAAIDAHVHNSRILLLVFGDGPLSSEVQSIGHSYPDVIRCHGRVVRTRYLEILADSDVGVVATVDGVSSPTFPSKCLDYMACELPILASVEAATDFGEIVENNGMGISCIAGDHDAMVKALLDLAANPNKRKEMGKKGNAYLRAHHSVSSICNSICDLAS